MEAQCPGCDAVVRLREPVLREVLECSECGAQLIVAEVNPVLRLEISEEIGEDWGE